VDSTRGQGEESGVPSAVRRGGNGQTGRGLVVGASRAVPCSAVRAELQKGAGA
jgi:hypothetical protein